MCECKGAKEISDPELITFCRWDEGENYQGQDHGNYR